MSDPRFHDVITWAPHGRAWKVLNRGRFLNEVVPEFFNLKYFKSFLRQVNGWGFTRINKGIDEGCYYHKVRYLFLLQTIQRNISNRLVAVHPGKARTFQVIQQAIGLQSCPRKYRYSHIFTF